MIGRKNRPKHVIRRIVTRMAGSHPNRAPDFFVAGANRCGTTTLHWMLRQHPEIYVPPSSEVHYFDNEALFDPQVRNYKYHFPRYRGEPIIGEVTPRYFEQGTLYEKDGSLSYNNATDAIKRIARCCPDAKIIVSLRDPIARIKSIYKKNFHQGKTSRSLEQELRAERNGEKSMPLVFRNKYEKSLAHLFGHFAPEAVRILVFEEWTQDLRTTSLELFGFLRCDQIVPVGGIPSEETNSLGRYRGQRQVIQEPDLTVSDEIREYVWNETEEARQYVNALLGRDVGWDETL